MNENNRVAEHNSSFYSILHFFFTSLRFNQIQFQFFCLYFYRVPVNSPLMNAILMGLMENFWLNINEVQSIYFIFEDERIIFKIVTNDSK